MIHHTVFNCFVTLIQTNQYELRTFLLLNFLRGLVCPYRNSDRLRVKGNKSFGCVVRRPRGAVAPVHAPNVNWIGCESGGYHQGQVLRGLNHCSKRLFKTKSLIFQAFNLLFLK